MSTLRTLPEIVAAIRASAAPGRRSIVGFAGSPGAGKSTIAADVVAAIGATATLLPMDGFHLPQQTLRAIGRRDRMGAPDTFDVPALLRILAELRLDRPDVSVHAPAFDREREEPIPDAIDITPRASIVLVEGNYLLLESGGWASVGGFLDLSFFVEVDHAIRLERLIARHERFGKSPAAARAWALGPDEENARLIEATAARADHIIALG